MNKAGGIIALIAGIFGFFAAIFTIFMGGAIDALGSSRHDSQSIFDFGLWGLFFSCAIIILGAIAIGVRSRKIGVSIVVLSLFGIVLGGTPVAICLMLSSVGGILCIVGGKKNDVVIAAPLSTITPITNSTLITPPSTPIQLFPKPVKKKTPIITWIAFAIFVPLGVLVIVGMFANKKTTENNQTTPSSDSDNTQNMSLDSSDDDPIVTLKKATPSDILPNGKLAELFNLGSKNTDLQREDAFNAIKGKVVEWTLPVYEVERDGDKGYKIQTGQGDYVGTFIYITPQNANDDIMIKNLKTDDMVKIKGIISDESIRNLVIKPAIIVSDASNNSVDTSATNAQQPTQTNNNSVSPTTPLPFIGKRIFNFGDPATMGNASESFIIIKKDGTTEIGACGENCYTAYKGKFSNPITVKNPQGSYQLRIKDNKIYISGKGAAGQGCDPTQPSECVSDLSSM